MEQLAAALDAAHASGLIHRDVKPANVLLGPNQHANDPFPDLSDQLPQLPAGLQAVVERGLAKDLADRYPSAGELAGALAGRAETVPGRFVDGRRDRTASGRAEVAR